MTRCIKWVKNTNSNFNFEKKTINYELLQQILKIDYQLMIELGYINHNYNYEIRLVIRLISYQLSYAPKKWNV